jgi:hypothetical protein
MRVAANPRARDKENRQDPRVSCSPRDDDSQEPLQLKRNRSAPPSSKHGRGVLSSVPLRDARGRLVASPVPFNGGLWWVYAADSQVGAERSAVCGDGPDGMSSRAVFGRKCARKKGSRGCMAMIGPRGATERCPRQVPASSQDQLRGTHASTRGGKGRHTCAGNGNRNSLVGEKRAAREGPRVVGACAWRRMYGMLHDKGVGPQCYDRAHFWWEGSLPYHNRVGQFIGGWRAC